MGEKKRKAEGKEREDSIDIFGVLCEKPSLLRREGGLPVETGLASVLL